MGGREGELEANSGCEAEILELIERENWEGGNEDEGVDDFEGEWGWMIHGGWKGQGVGERSN